MVRIRGVKCAVSTDGHLLRGDGVLITNPKHVEFVRKRMIDFRPENLVCADCAKNLAQIYDIKLKRALEQRKQRDTLAISSSSSLDDFDRMVYRTPRTKHLRDFVKQNAPYQLRESSQPTSDDAEKENQDNNESAATNVSLQSIPAPVTPSMSVNNDESIYSTTSIILEEPAAFVELSVSTDISDISSLDLGPSTSASAAAAAADKAQEKQKKQAVDKANNSIVWRQPAEPAKRKKVHFEQESPESRSSSKSPPVQAARPTNQQPVTANTISATTSRNDYSDDFTSSPNALNGTRMPHVQPIPKRRQFQHVVPGVQEIYMQGIFGG